MLQIVTKMYFRDGIPVRTNEIRRVLYSNRHVVTSGEIDLPVGSLLASGSHSEPVFAFTVKVIEHLETKNLDGSDAMLVGTSGVELVDDLAAVLSFRTDSLFTRDVDLARRLLAELPPRRESAKTLFKDTFDDMRFLSDEEIDDFRVFLSALLRLTRSHYVAAMRAIRRVVRATQRAVDDPTLACVDMVAALESLADATATKPSWDRLDHRKRALIDTALEGARADVAARVRDVRVHGVS